MQMQIRAVVLVVALLAGAALATSPSDYFSSADEAAYKALVKEKSSESLANAFHAVNLFPGEAKSSELCKLAEKGLESKDLATLFQAITVSETLKCTKSKVSDDVAKKLNEGLESGSLLDKYHAVAAIAKLAANEHFKIDPKLFNTVFDKIAAQADSDGTFKVGTEPDGSAYYAGLAYQAFADVYPSLETSAKDKLATISGTIDKLLRSIDEQEQGSAFSHSDSTVSALTTTSAVLRGIAKLGAALGNKFKANIGSNIVNKLATYVISQKSTSVLATADSVYGALKALDSGVVPRPIAVTVSPSSIQASAKKEDAAIRVKVSDLFGGRVSGATVFLSKAYLTSNAGTPLLSNQELTADDKGTYQIGLLAAKPEPGSYTLDIRVTTKDNTKWTAIDSATRTVKVVSSVELVDGELSVGTKDNDEGEVHSLTTGQQLKEVVKVGSGKFIHISFRLKNKISTKPLIVQQAFVTLTNKDANEDVFFVTPYDSAKKLYKLKIDASKLKNASGKYTLRVIIGDANIDNSFEWVVGTLALELPAVGPKKQSIFVPLPEINHIFRKPEVRPPAIVSQTFTLLVLAPLALLVIGWLFVGLNFSYFPGGLSALAALAFHLCLAALVGVYALFFLELNLFETLKYLAIVGGALILFGHPTLRAVALKRSGTAPTH